jgi:hypothetical protein
MCRIQIAGPAPSGVIEPNRLAFRFVNPGGDPTNPCKDYRQNGNITADADYDVGTKLR